MTYFEIKHVDGSGDRCVEFASAKYLSDRG